MKLKIEDAMDNEVVVAIIALPGLLNSWEAREVYKEYAPIILSTQSPVLYKKEDYVFIYGVTTKMKTDPEYYQEFIDACGCQNSKNIEIFGMNSKI